MGAIQPESRVQHLIPVSIEWDASVSPVDLYPIQIQTGPLRITHFYITTSEAVTSPGTVGEISLDIVSNNGAGTRTEKGLISPTTGAGTKSAATIGNAVDSGLTSFIVSTGDYLMVEHKTQGGGAGKGFAVIGFKLTQT